MTIACVGITVLDRVFRVNQLPKNGGKYVANDYFEVGGGPAATAAVAISKLGVPVEFIGRIGDDSVAQTIVDEFSYYNVGQNFIHQIPSACSSFSAIMVDNEGERMIINYQDPRLTKDAEWMQKIDFSSFNALLCDVRWINGAAYALRQAKKLGIPTILDADITPDAIDELVELTDHIVFSQPGLAKFSGENDPIKGLHFAQTKTNGKVYVTAGSEGCYWLEDGNLCHQKGFKVNVVDTTGAGDVFHGAFALAVAEKMPTRDAVIFSSAVAALKCTKLGGRDGIPDRNTVNQFIKDYLSNA